MFKVLLLSVAVFALCVTAPRAEEQNLPSASGTAGIAEDYCESFSNLASELRVERQLEELEKVKGEIGDLLKDLDARSTQLDEMVKRRDEMLKLASNELVNIYKRMEPEPAARQLEKVHSHTAVSVLRRLEPKQASEILAEMGTERASILIQIIANENTELMKEKKS